MVRLSPARPRLSLAASDALPRRTRCLVAAALLCLMLGCGSDEESEASGTLGLRSRERFTWTGGQPVGFALPPEDWYRQRAQNGGEEGVRFIKKDSVGEVISVAELFGAGRRDRCQELDALLADLDSLRKRDFAQRLQVARPYAEPAWNDDEADLSLEANEALSRAAAAFRAGEVEDARSEIEHARERVTRIVFELEDVEHLIRKPSFDMPGVKGRNHEPEWLDRGDYEFLRQDYDLRDRGNDLIGRRYYVVANNRLFVIAFQGLRENLGLFEAIVDSLSFPEGPCEHGW